MMWFDKMRRILKNWAMEDEHVLKDAKRKAIAEVQKLADSIEKAQSVGDLLSAMSNGASKTLKLIPEILDQCNAVDEYLFSTSKNRGKVALPPENPTSIQCPKNPGKQQPKNLLSRPSLITEISYSSDIERSACTTSDWCRDNTPILEDTP